MIQTARLHVFPHTAHGVVSWCRLQAAEAASSRRLVQPHADLTPPPTPLLRWLVVWRNAADRLPRRVLISGRDNDPAVIGSWPPGFEIAGVRSWLHAFRSA